MKNIYLTAGFICIMASVVMFMVGSSNSHLTELVDFFWVPLPLGVVLFMVGAQQKK
jgi:hypothetical protein